MGESITEDVYTQEIISSISVPVDTYGLLGLVVVPPRPTQLPQGPVTSVAANVEYEEVEAKISRAFEEWGAHAYCVWLGEGAITGYYISATNDHGPWALHLARWKGDNGLGEVFYAWGGQDIYDFDETTRFVVWYTTEYNGHWGWSMWYGWGC